jgi:hypothetical protein
MNHNIQLFTRKAQALKTAPARDILAIDWQSSRNHNVLGLARLIRVTRSMA